MIVGPACTDRSPASISIRSRTRLLSTIAIGVSTGCALLHVGMAAVAPSVLTGLLFLASLVCLFCALHTIGRHGLRDWFGMAFLGLITLGVHLLIMVPVSGAGNTGGSGIHSAHAAAPVVMHEQWW